MGNTHKSRFLKAQWTDSGFPGRYCAMQYFLLDKTLEIAIIPFSTSNTSASFFY